ncbi:Rv3654c family TadE-like protein [Sinomonas albida]|uniref:Rv3654c family TadE-like protein n=1 Tax=Sinomonas albida TaxID=369942 RepID=UPI0010A777F1|nr:Rv3654c family TadE-like protein [Sinomonas albida]
MTRPPGPGVRDLERGAGTILALGLALAVVLGVGACALVAEGLASAARAALAADLAALIGADAERGLRAGPACGAAGEVARLNGAELVACEIERPGQGVRVRVRVPAPPPLDAVEGRARAGAPP